MKKEHKINDDAGETNNIFHFNKKKTGLTSVAVAVVLTVLLISPGITSTIVWNEGTGVKINGIGMFSGVYDYVIVNDDTTTYCINGTTGNVFLSDTNTSRLINYVLENKTDSKYETMFIADNGYIYDIASPIYFYNNTGFYIEGDLNWSSICFQNYGYDNKQVKTNVHFYGMGGVIDTDSASSGSAFDVIVSNSSFHNLIITDSIFHGINIVGYSNNVLIEGCSLYDCEYGMQCHFDEDDLIPVRNVTITNNNIIRCCQHDYPSGALWISGCIDVIISDNKILDCEDGVGVMLYNGDDIIGLQHIKLVNNIITGDTNSYYGVWVRSGVNSGSLVEDILISGNTIMDFNDVGINVRSENDTIYDIVIENNYIKNCLVRGISVSDDDGEVSGVSIIGNEITEIVDDTYSIGIQIGTNNVIGSVISNNIIHDFTSPACRGIILSSEKGMVCSNNYIYDMGNDGIGIDINDNATVTGNYFRDLTGIDGIRVAAGVTGGAIIANNYFTNVNTGIDENNGCNNNVIIGNNFNGCTTNMTGTTGANTIIEHNIG